MLKPHVIAVMAADEANAIGKAGGLPWHLPDDLKRFKDHTIGMPIIMGRRTWESFGGRLLPHRRHVIVSNSLTQADVPEGVVLVGSWPEALAVCDGEPRVALIGGAQLLRDGFADVDELVLTRVHTILEDADTFLHPWPAHEFAPQGTPIHHQVDGRHAFAFTEVRWVRKRA